ncbi:hypothetical protein NDU88_002881 [Pleurodeles waltl]|uniref:Uncharacterized protein n=1 Tax=Pleurodeles waltl TaxID=8319 RepID=A0AAV7KTC6_PLEWA|nr:hypothetical protein NDU88_002881 [Pleurodeles waltl]
MEKCPRGTKESIALLRPNVDTKQEEGGHCVGQEGGGDKDVGERSEGNKQQMLEEDIDDRKEATERKTTSGKNGEETSDSRTPIEEKKEDNSRLQFWNPPTCHVPRGTWLEQVLVLHLRFIRTHTHEVNFR